MQVRIHACNCEWDGSGAGMASVSVLVPESVSGLFFATGPRLGARFRRKMNLTPIPPDTDSASPHRE